jgi:hypothetical protein
MILRPHPRRDGNVVVVVAAALVAILGAAALSLDGGALMDKRRQIQSTADAAALSAADDLYANWWTNLGLDPAGSAVTAARATAEANGFTHGVGGCTVDVFVPPQTGQFVGVKGHAEVRISVNQQRYFSKVFGSSTVPVGGRAVSRGRRGQIKNGIIILDPAASGSLNAAGNGVVSVTGAPVLVNSSSSTAMIANGGGVLTAPEFDVVGSPGLATPGGGILTGTVMASSQPVQDPLRYLPVPDPATMTVQYTKKLSISSANGQTLNPGVYQGGVQITGKGSVTLNPGIYYMQGGGFSWAGQGNLTANGVMIYNAPTGVNDKIQLTGTGTASLSPPTSGPYQGMAVFQDRASNVPVELAGNGGMSLSGAFYSAGATLQVTGNGTVDVIGAQYISNQLILSGNGNFNVNWTVATTPGLREILLVE